MRGLRFLVGTGTIPLVWLDPLPVRVSSRCIYLVLFSFHHLSPLAPHVLVIHSTPVFFSFPFRVFHCIYISQISSTGRKAIISIFSTRTTYTSILSYTIHISSSPLLLSLSPPVSSPLLISSEIRIFVFLALPPPLSRSLSCFKLKSHFSLLTPCPLCPIDIDMYRMFITFRLPVFRVFVISIPYRYLFSISVFVCLSFRFSISVCLVPFPFPFPFFCSLRKCAPVS